MTNAPHNLRPAIAGLLGCLLLGLTACVHVSNPEMPASWPALHRLTTVSGLDGTYRGNRQQCAGFTQAFFPRRQLPVLAVEGFRLTTLPEGLQVEALAGTTVLDKRVIEVQLDAGAVTFAHKEAGQDGGASHRYLTTLQSNANGELVASFHISSFGSSTTEWGRLPGAAR